MKSNQNTVLITGGSMGIGLALAKLFVEKDNEVIITGRNPETLDKLCSQFGFKAIAGDLSVPADLNNLVEQIQEEYITLNVLINNAGIQKNYQLNEKANHDHQIDQELAVNLNAPIKLCSALLPLLASHPPSAIVNVSSVLAMVPKRSAPVYCASKAGIHLFTKALRYQLEGTGVEVFEIIPPLVDTAMTAGRGKDKMSPDDLAREFFANFLKGKHSTYAGKAKVLRMIQRVAPGIADNILKNN